MVALSSALLSETARPRRATGNEQEAAPRMRLADYGDDALDVPEPASLRLDRRTFPRRELSLKVHGRRLDHSVDARREPFLYFDMKDVSVGGLLATSQTALQVGERVAVFFPPEGASRGWDAYGRVLRVHPAQHGYRVAVAFDALPAA